MTDALTNCKECEFYDRVHAECSETGTVVYNPVTEDYMQTPKDCPKKTGGEK